MNSDDTDLGGRSCLLDIAPESLQLWYEPGESAIRASHGSDTPFMTSEPLPLTQSLMASFDGMVLGSGAQGEALGTMTIHSK